MAYRGAEKGGEFPLPSLMQPGKSRQSQACINAEWRKEGEGGTPMGKLEEKSDGYYILEVEIGCVTVKKAFMDADKPLEEISAMPMPDGFYLEISDVENK